MRTDLFLLAGALMLSGCAADQTGLASTRPAFGEANRQTMMAQVIDPDPQYEYADPETSGEHAAQAITRYRADKVKKPQTIRTSDVGAQGSGAGSAGGSGGN